MCKRLYIFCITIRFDYIAEFPLSFDEHLLYLCIMSNVIADMLRIPEQAGHQFRFNPARYSG
jgi:hypothetical protein